MADYADSYTLSGCHSNFFCGVFTRVEAHCAAGSGARCPGGASAAAVNADPALCDGAPVYEKVGTLAGTSENLVLFRQSEGGGTRWLVSSSSSLSDCTFHGAFDGHMDCGRGCPRGDLNPGRPGYAPTAPAYGQWSTPHYHESISVVAGGGR